MSNEAEILNNPTSTPAAVSTGYQRQNINAVASRVGMDKTVVSGGTGKCTLEISGPVDVNGVPYSIEQSKDFTLSSADRYYIYLSGSGDYLTPTIDTDPGTFDADKNARYTAGGYRVLNWVIDYDGTTAIAYQWLNPSEDGNCFIENDLVVGNEIKGSIDLFEDVTVLTGTTAAGSNITDISYPTGYTQANSICLAARVYSAASTYVSLGHFVDGSDTVSLSVQFTSTDIDFVVPSATYRSKAYTLILAKL